MSDANTSSNESSSDSEPVNKGFGRRGRKSKDRPSSDSDSKAHKRIKLSLVTVQRQNDATSRGAPIDIDSEPDESSKLCMNSKCGEKLKTRHRRGPNGVPLCYPCGDAYRKASDEARAEGEATDSEWEENSNSATVQSKSRSKPKKEKITLLTGKKKYEKGKKGTQRGRIERGEKHDCANPHCANPGQIPGALVWGPDEEPLCRNCGARYLHLRKKTPAGKKVPDTWKIPKNTGGKKRDNPECKECGTHVSTDWTNDLCDDCRRCHEKYKDRDEEPPQRLHNSGIPNFVGSSNLTHTAITGIAYERWRALNPDHDPAIEHRQPTYGPNYFDLGQAQLRPAVRARGIVGRDTENGAVSQLIRYLQVADAYNGLLPAPRPGHASQYHEMHIMDLKNLAMDRGYFRQSGEQPEKKDSYIRFLCEQDEGDISAIVQPIEEASRQETTRQLYEDLREWVDRYGRRYGITLPPALKSKQTKDAHQTAASMTHTTHNGGMVASREIFGRLNDHVLMTSRFPTQTSSEGLLCGPRAWVNSMRDELRNMRNTNHPLAMHWPEGVDDEEFMHRIMEEAFTNYRRGITPTTRGIPTEAYQRVIDERIGNLREGNLADQMAYQYQLENFLNLNNVDVEQLGAFGRLLATTPNSDRFGGINLDFGLSVTLGAHVNEQGQQRPAQAYEVCPGDHRLPQLWVHNNVAQGGGRYNHFESYTIAGRIEWAFEAGLRTGDSGEIKSTIFSKADPQARQSVTNGLRRQLRTLQTEVATRLRKLAKCCLPCQENDYTNCDSRPGKPCNNCKAAKKQCFWPEIEMFMLPPKPSGEIVEDIMDYEGPLYNMEQILDMAKQYKATTKPEGKHFLIIGSARMSSHGGMVAVGRLMHNLVHTVQNYHALMASPIHNDKPEGQLPGGQVVPAQRQTLYMVFARRGVLQIPATSQNVNDPMLIAHAELWDDIMAPNGGYGNLPEEILYVVMGMPGLTVPITGFGDRQSGFMGSILQRDDAQGTVANRIFIVAIVEPHVVNGTANSIDPNQALHGWVRYGNKFIRKFKLLDLIDRWDLHKYKQVHDRLNPGNPFQLPNTQYDQDMDSFLLGLSQEAMLRWGHLPLVPPAAQPQAPTVGILRARQDNRNDALQPPGP